MIKGSLTGIWMSHSAVMLQRITSHLRISLPVPMIAYIPQSSLLNQTRFRNKKTCSSVEPLKSVRIYQRSRGKLL